MTFRSAASKSATFGGMEDQAVFAVDQFGNPLTWNQDSIIVLASGSVSANGASPTNLRNLNGKGLLLYITPGAFGASESTMVVTVQGVDPISGNTDNILASASLVASTPVKLRIYPGLTAAANTIANDVLPPTWKVTWTAVNWGTGGSVLGIAAAILV